MEKYKLSPEWIQRNSEKIKRAYDIILLEKYDVTSVDDVLKVLQEIDSRNANEENAKIFSKVLQLFATQLKKKFEPKQEVKPKVIN